MAAPQNRAAPITEETEVYRDLGIYGDEIVDLVWWLEKEFGVKTNIDPFRFAPRETNFFGLRRTIRRMLGYEAQYESLKVRDLIAAIEAERWPDEASS
jgi:acyl carrier protein